MNKKSFVSQKIVALVTAVLLVLSSTPINAMGSEHIQRTPDWFSEKIQDFFSEQALGYDLYNFQGQNITEEFYQTNYENYQNGKIPIIYERFCNNIKTMERTTIVELPKTKATGDVTVQVRKDFTEKVESTNGVYGLYLDWTMNASYVKNDINPETAGYIISTSKPTLSNYRFYNYYPTFMLPQIASYSTSSKIENNMAKFSLTIDTAFVTVEGTHYTSLPQIKKDVYFGG